jgi:DNA-binding Lrp family transcriptional regulator
MRGLDQQILARLRENARESNLSMASELSVSEGTIRKHIADLKASGTIQRFTVDVKRDAAAIVELKTTPNIDTTIIAKNIKALGVRQVVEVAGSYDIICFIEAESLAMMNEMIEQIRGIEGVKETQTMPVLKNI